MENDRSESIARIRESLLSLQQGEFISLQEYRKLVSRKKLIHPKVFEDDRAFQAKHPSHPLAMDNRDRRINLADAVRDTARGFLGVLPEEILELLYTAMFDCCAAVRLSMIYALFCAGSRRSAHALSNLIEEESESPMVRRYALIARDRCLMREVSPFHEKKRLVMLVSDDIELAGAVGKVAEEEGAILFLPEPDFTELMAWSCEITVVAPSFMGQKNWDAFCDYLEEVNETESVYPLKDEDGTVISEESHRDDKPLILINFPPGKDFRKPKKPEGSVYFLGSWQTDIVKQLLSHLLKGGHRE